jgi:hypothetical protein
MKTTTAKVTARFEERKAAEKFATQWSIFTKRGHAIGSGWTDVDVTVWDVTPDELDWIKTALLILDNQYQ